MKDELERQDEGNGAPHGEAGPGGNRVVYKSGELLKGQREVWIEHGTEMYRLRLTSAGKLYLTK